MTAPNDSHPGLSEVQRLTAALTDRVLDAQVMGQPIPEDQVRALTKAAGLLQDSGVPWPPMLTQVMHELAQAPGEAPVVDKREAPAGLDVGGLSRFFSGLRRDRGEA